MRGGPGWTDWGWTGEWGRGRVGVPWPWVAGAHVGGGEEQGGGELEQYRLRYVLAVLRLRRCGRRTTPPLALLVPRPTPRPRLREEATVLVRLRLVVVAVFIVVLHLWAVAGGSASRCSARPAPYYAAIAATSFALHSRAMRRGQPEGQEG